MLTTEMRLCSEQETCVEEVSVWPEVAPPSAGPEAKEVDPVDKWERKASCLDYKHEKKREPKVSCQRSTLRLWICRFAWWSQPGLNLVAAPRHGAKDSHQAQTLESLPQPLQTGAKGKDDSH
jgi:hypothetical protein